MHLNIYIVSKYKRQAGNSNNTVTASVSELVKKCSSVSDTGTLDTGSARAIFSSEIYVFIYVIPEQNIFEF